MGQRSPVTTTKDPNRAVRGVHDARNPCQALDASAPKAGRTCGVDGSRASLNAARWAVAEAINRDVPLRLVHVSARRSAVNRTGADRCHVTALMWCCSAPKTKSRTWEGPSGSNWHGLPERPARSSSASPAVRANDLRWCTTPGAVSRQAIRGNRHGACRRSALSGRAHPTRWRRVVARRRCCSPWFSTTNPTMMPSCIWRCTKAACGMPLSGKSIGASTVWVRRYPDVHVETVAAGTGCRTELFPPACRRSVGRRGPGRRR